MLAKRFSFSSKNSKFTELRVLFSDSKSTPKLLSKIQQNLKQNFQIAFRNVFSGSQVYEILSKTIIFCDIIVER